jgi:ABC-type xylose transport system permease subunit
MKWIAGVVGSIIGLMAGYYVIAYSSCTWFWPNSNLCGLPGVPAAFVGAIVGYWAAFWIVKRALASRSN